MDEKMYNESSKIVNEFFTNSEKFAKNNSLPVPVARQFLSSLIDSMLLRVYWNNYDSITEEASKGKYLEITDKILSEPSM